MNLLALLLTGALAATTNTPHRQYADRAAALQQAGADFDATFSALCSNVLVVCDRDPDRRVDDEVRALFGGLWLWARAGGRPTLFGQPDKALHFIGGGAFQGYLDAGRAAAVIKEELDRRDPGNAFDLDDLAATMMGARWVDLATTDDQQQNRRWVAHWADPRRRLSATLPALTFGRLAQGVSATPAELKRVQEAVVAGLKPLPASP
jgi:hypothetical protein